MCSLLQGLYSVQLVTGTVQCAACYRDCVSCTYYRTITMSPSILHTSRITRVINHLQLQRRIAVTMFTQTASNSIKTRCELPDVSLYPFDLLTAVDAISLSLAYVAIGSFSLTHFLNKDMQPIRHIILF